MTAPGRPREFDRAQALETAMRLFWRKGFAATSIADLCEAMEIRSPSLYAAFGDKGALYREAFAHYVQTVGPPIWDRLGQGASARGGLEAMLLAAAQAMPESEARPPGCMVLLGAVGDEWPAEVAGAAKDMRRELLRQIRARLEAGAAAGELPAATDCDRLSRFYLAVSQGMAIQARDGADAAELRRIAEAAMAAWPAAGV